MKRTFVLLIFTLSQTSRCYAQAVQAPLDQPSTLAAPQSSTAPANQSKKPDLLLNAQLKVREGIVLASEMSGLIKNFTLRNGEHFSAGQVLAHFSCPKEQSRLAEMKTILDQQNKAKQHLDAMHSINTLEIGMVNAEREIAQADVNIAEALVDRCAIHAPFDGKMVKLIAKPAQSVRAGDPLMQIVDDHNQEVELLVSAHEMSHIKLGQSYQVNSNIKAKPYTVELTSWGGRVDPSSQTVKIYGRLDNTKPLPPGENVVALIGHH